MPLMPLMPLMTINRSYDKLRTRTLMPLMPLMTINCNYDKLRTRTLMTLIGFPVMIKASEGGGIQFVSPAGPPMRALGDKIGSTIIAQNAGVPCIAWNSGHVVAEYDIARGTLPEEILLEACVLSAADASRGLRPLLPPPPHVGCFSHFDLYCGVHLHYKLPNTKNPQKIREPQKLTPI